MKRAAALAVLVAGTAAVWAFGAVAWALNWDLDDDDWQRCGVCKRESRHVS